MKFLKQLFAKEPNSSPIKTVEKVLSKLKIDSEEELPQHYHEILMEVSQQPFKPRLLFRALIERIGQTSTVAGVVKLFTIIFNLLRKTNYPAYYLE
jgi:hypothetical protein